MGRLKNILTETKDLVEGGRDSGKMIYIVTKGDSRGHEYKYESEIYSEDIKMALADAQEYHDDFNVKFDNDNDDNQFFQLFYNTDMNRPDWKEVVMKVVAALESGQKLIVGGEESTTGASRNQKTIDYEVALADCKAKEGEGFDAVNDLIQ